jgi:hypothetical protein
LGFASGTNRQPAASRETPPPTPAEGPAINVVEAARFDTDIGIDLAQAGIDFFGDGPGA